MSRLDDECPRPMITDSGALSGLVPGIFPASVYRCEDPADAEALLRGGRDGYAYQRDGHPNAAMLAEKCRRLHEAKWAVITSTGMSAIAVATLTLLETGQHVVVSDQLYGRTTQLLTQCWQRLGVKSTLVDTHNLTAVEAALKKNSRLIVIETLTNPTLRVAQLDKLAVLAHDNHAQLLVDNTFATPILCRPLDHGADYVVESISKMMNGHSDVMLGMLCGRDDRQMDFRDTLSVWGASSSPFDDWLALRGLATLHLRMERASANAWHVAQKLDGHHAVQRVLYPTRADHPDRETSERLFAPQIGGSMVTFELFGGLEAATKFLRHAREIPFCPSLGEVSSTLSHPASTSHRGLTASERAERQISDGTIRLSLGTESAEWCWQALQEGLQALSK